MTTGSSSHTHTVKVGSTTYTTSSRSHTHSETPDPDAAAIAALTARVAALEAPVPPPVIPPPVVVPPPPTGRPFPPPVTARTVNIPTTIDKTGAADVQAALNAFLATVPDGSVIAFPPAAIYRLSRGITVQNRHNLVFEGNGATMRSTGLGTSMWDCGFVISGSLSSVTDIAIRDFTLEAANTRTGTDIYDPSHESQHGIGVYGSSRVEIDGCTIRRTFGDGVYVANGTTQEWPTDLWVHHTTFGYIGRNAFTLNAVRRALLERNTLDQIGASVLDIEPDLDYQGVQDVTLRDNTTGVWGKTSRYTMHFVACANQTAAPSATVDGLTITGNTVTAGAPSSANTPNAGGLAMWIGRPARQKRVTVTGNTTTKAGAGPVLRFEHVDGLTYHGNVQPLTSGSLASVSDCTNVDTTA